MRDLPRVVKLGSGPHGGGAGRDGGPALFEHVLGGFGRHLERRGDAPCELAERRVHGGRVAARDTYSLLRARHRHVDAPVERPPPLALREGAVLVVRRAVLDGPHLRREEGPLVGVRAVRVREGPLLALGRPEFFSKELGVVPERLRAPADADEALPRRAQLF